MEDKLQIIRGDDIAFTVLITDKDDLSVDITNCIVFFTVKRRKDDTDAEAVIAVTIDSHVDPTHGKTRITVPKSTTKFLKLGDYYWDLQIKYQDGTIQSSISDVLTVFQDITIRTTEDLS